MADYYVSLFGNDSTGDGSVGNPWLTVTKAVTVAGSGDTVYILADEDNYSYTGKIPNNLNGINLIGYGLRLPYVESISEFYNFNIVQNIYFYSTGNNLLNGQLVGSAYNCVFESYTTSISNTNGIVLLNDVVNVTNCIMDITNLTIRAIGVADSDTTLYNCYFINKNSSSWIFVDNPNFSGAPTTYNCARNSTIKLGSSVNHNMVVTNEALLDNYIPDAGSLLVDAGYGTGAPWDDVDSGDGTPLYPAQGTLQNDIGLWGGAYAMQVEVVQPQDTTISALATGTLSTYYLWASSYQWQVKEDDTWVDLDGETGETLEITPIMQMSGWQYRCVFTLPDDSTLVSDAATLTVTYSHPSGAATIYVNGFIGDDWSDGLTELTPLKNFDEAYLRAASGDTITLAGGYQYTFGQPLMLNVQFTSLTIKTYEESTAKAILVPSFSSAKIVNIGNIEYNNAFYLNLYNLRFPYSSNYTSYIISCYNTSTYWGLGFRLNAYNCDFIGDGNINLSTIGSTELSFSGDTPIARFYQCVISNFNIAHHRQSVYVGARAQYIISNNIYTSVNVIASGFLYGYGNLPSDVIRNCCKVNSGGFWSSATDCISADPLFVDEYYKLQDGSPCIDTGYAWTSITTYPENRPPAKGEAAYDIGSWGGRYTLADGSMQTNFYVSKNGNDTTGEGTLLNPYQTLAKCIERIQELGNYGNIYVVTSEAAYEIENVNVELSEQSKIAGYGGTAIIRILSGGSFKITGTIEDLDIYTQASTFEINGSAINSKIVGSPDYPNEDEVEKDVEFAYGTMVGTYEGGAGELSSVENPERIITGLNQYPALPTVIGTYSNGAIKEFSVTWDESLLDITTAGTYTLTADVEGLTATLTIVVLSQWQETQRKPSAWTQRVYPQIEWSNK